MVATGDYNANQADVMTRTMLPAMKRAGYGDVLGQQYGVNPHAASAPRRRPRVGELLQPLEPLRPLLQLRRRAARTSGNMIDYIFASNNLRVTYFKTVLALPPANLRVTGRMPSDHNMLRATVLVP